MDINIVISRSMMVAVVLCGLLLTARPTASACVPPNVIDGYSAVGENGTLVKTVSLPTSSVSRTALRCLGESFHRKYGGNKLVQVLVFGDSLAAKHWRVGRPDYSTPTSAAIAKIHDRSWLDRQVRAIYSFDRATAVESIRMTPFGWPPFDPYDTIINLRVADTPPCRLNISGRCVVTAVEPTFPYEAYKANVSAEIPVTAVFTRRGVPVDVRVSNEFSAGIGLERYLADKAVADLKEWRVEPSSHDDRIRIVYGFTVDRSVALGHADVTFELPTKISVRAHYDN